MSLEQNRANKQAVIEFASLIEAIERGDYPEATTRQKALHGLGWSVRSRWAMDGGAGARKPLIPRPGPLFSRMGLVKSPA